VGSVADSIVGRPNVSTTMRRDTYTITRHIQADASCFYHGCDAFGHILAFICSRGLATTQVSYCSSRLSPDRGIVAVALTIRAERHHNFVEISGSALVLSTYFAFS
jgi:hypothetical protein